MSFVPYSCYQIGKGRPLVLLHGLFGMLSNWESVCAHLSSDFEVIIPELPVYSGPKHYASLNGLLSYVEEFIAHRKLKEVSLMGNSLGGHLALLYALKYPSQVRCMVLTGSSGLYEMSMGSAFFRRGDYEAVRERVQYTFYDPEIVSEEFIQDIFQITRNISKCLRVVAIAKTAQRKNLASELPSIAAPTQLIWGLNDTITPPSVAHHFHVLLQHSVLHFLDKCCHVPMMEHPATFNDLVKTFLLKPMPSPEKAP